MSVSSGETTNPLDRCHDVKQSFNPATHRLVTGIASVAHGVTVIQYCACASLKAKDMRRLRFGTKNLTEDLVTFLGDICKRLPRVKNAVVFPGGCLMLAS